MSSAPGQITVVGAGVIGLTTALALEAAGHDVTVVTASPPESTTSAIAGAVWFPYRVGPMDRVPTWAARTRARWIELAASAPAAGVELLTAFELDDGDERPWWAEGIDELVQVRPPVAGAAKAWRFLAPRIDPRRFLPYAVARLRRPPRQERVDTLAALPGDRIVVCAGLGARRLVGDPSLRGVRGQIAIAQPGDCELAVTITDDRPPGPIFYVIPRHDQVVLGGTADEVADDEPGPPDPAVRARILAQAAALGVRPGAVIADRVGLRPYRPAVRLERDPRDPRLLYHYGHGGAGYTLAWGCADDVVALVAASA